jgi:nicotinate phosphoribosyltransferase
MPYSPRPDYYREALAEKSAFWADLYALTMSQALFTNEKHNINTTFQAFIRKPPFGGSYLVTGGQNIIAEWLDKNWKFTQRNIEQMREKTARNPVSGAMTPLFTPAFIDMVKNAKLELTIDAMEEGELAFPDEPIYRVHGPVWQCLMIEAALLNALNSQSLFATLATRMKEATASQHAVSFTQHADRDPILEFGLRRAQDVGGIAPSRGAYIGGVDATSNLLAEEYYGIPTQGTFAHALVMLYEDELAAFTEYAKAMPNNGIFLVDTYNTLEGVKKACKACKDAGASMKGIRLDSGDLAYLSKESRKILDREGFTDARIAASNDLDEQEILKLKRGGAKIDIWGVGTNLVTSKSQPALGAVYKLVAVFDPRLSMKEIEALREGVNSGEKSADALSKMMRDVIKLGERPPPGQLEKATTPGEQEVLRFLYNDAADGWRLDGDTIYPASGVLPVRREKGAGPFDGYLTAPVTSVPKDDPYHAKTFPIGTPVALPLKSMFNHGDMKWLAKTVHEAREYAREAFALLGPDYKQLDHARTYGVGLEKNLYREREDLIRALRSPPQP